MSHEGRLFLEACGTTGPLRFEWTDPSMAKVRNRAIEQAAFVIGRDPVADLVLDDPRVAPLHAFCQVVDGRLFAVDLESPDGLRWGEIPRVAGWVDRGQALRIGRHTVRLIDGDCAGAESVGTPAPTSARYLSRSHLPRVVLEFRTAAEGKGGSFKRAVLDRVLVLAGGSERGKLKFGGNRVVRFAFALIRTPSGLWLTNFLPNTGATVNGATCRFARLEDEDIVQIGAIRIRVLYDDSPRTPIDPALSSPRTAISPGPAVPPRAPGEMALPSDERSPELLLQSLLEQAASDPGPPSSSPFGQALILMVRLLGDVHRDHLALVRDELAEIRRLSRDMDRLRTEMQPPAPRYIAFPPSDPLNGTSHPAGLGSPLELEGVPRPGPEAVREIIGERLEAWERERQGRWRRVLRLLMRP